MQSLLKAKDSHDWISKHQRLRLQNMRRTWKTVKRKDYERKLLNDLLRNEESQITHIINEYWSNLLLENEKIRYGRDTAVAFQQLKNIFGYDKFEKRDGSIVDAVMKDGEIITNTDEVNLALMEVLRELQIDKTKPNSNIEPFPDMRELCYEEAMALVERMSTNKAISTDLFSDVIFQPQFREKTAEVIQNLWSKESLDCLDMTNFEARLIPLNKIPRNSKT